MSRCLALVAPFGAASGMVSVGRRKVHFREGVRMKIPRLFIAGCAFGLLLVCPVLAAEPRSSEPTLHDVTARLDAILQRIEQLEDRIARIERLVFPVTGEPDKHGVLRDATGRPIGIWGIDDPHGPEHGHR